MHFPPKPGYPEVDNSTYVVVFRRLDPGTIIYEGVFPIIKGDRFYRYRTIIKDAALH